MDMVDILGGLLGHKTSTGGRGGEALNDIFGRRSQPSSRSSSSGGSQPIDISREAQDLEDLLNVANGQHRPGSSGHPSSSPSRTPSPKAAPPARHQSAGNQQQALILVRAMVNAAKADGRLDQNEQENILKHMSNTTADSIQFLREEFQRPLDVREFALSVPVGMEQQVYTVSLIAIDLDTGQEAKYLMELAELLRLPVEVREQIHQRLGAPSIY